MNFTILDWSIIIVYVALSLAAGLMAQSSLSLGFRTSSWRAAASGCSWVSTLAATEIGTVTFMYYAELGYKTGFSSFVNGLIAGCVMIVIGCTGLSSSGLRGLQFMTVPEYFQCATAGTCGC